MLTVVSGRECVLSGPGMAERVAMVMTVAAWGRRTLSERRD